MTHKDSKEDKKLIRKAVRQHEAHDHPDNKFTNLKLKGGGGVNKVYRKQGRKS